MVEDAPLSAVDALRAKLRRLEGQRDAVRPALAFGIQSIDDHLPGGGMALGSLHEVACGGNGSLHGAAAALFAAGILARTAGPIVWCVGQHDLFAPALAQVGLDTDRITFIEAGDEKSILACFEEALRHTGVAGVGAEVTWLSDEVSHI